MEKLQMLKPPNYAHKIVHYFTTCPDFNEIIRTDGRITIQTWDMHMYVSCKLQSQRTDSILGWRCTWRKDIR